MAVVEGPTYRLPDGRILFVSAGLGGDTFGTFYRKPSGVLQRFKSPEMPMVDSRDEAKRNLGYWAAAKGLLPVEFHRRDA